MVDMGGELYQISWATIHTHIKEVGKYHYVHISSILLNTWGISFILEKHFNTIFQLISNRYMIIIINKVYYAVDSIYPLINGLCGGYRRNHINTCSEPIITFSKKNITLIFCNTSHIDGGDKYAPNLQDFERK